MRSDFWSLPWAARQAIQSGERAENEANRAAYSMRELQAKVAELEASTAIAQKRVNELEAAAANFLDLWEKEPNGADTLRAAFPLRAALPTMLKGNGDG